MTTIQAAALQRIQEWAAATMRQALEDAHLDRELVSRSFNIQLAALKLPPRPVIFYPNLRAAFKRVGEIAKVFWDTVRSSPWDSASNDAWHAARSGASTVARSAAWDAAWNGAWEAARSGARFDASDAVREDAWSAWHASLSVSRVAAWDPAGFATMARATAAASDAAYEAAWDAAWAAALCSAPSPDDGPSLIAAGCFLEILRGGVLFFWTAPDALHVVLAQIHTQKTQRVFETPGIRHTIARLHREDGPAIQYEDGSGLYFWNGNRVREEVVLRPDEMRVQDILAEQNTEARRVMMERYGLERFVLDAGAKVLDEWKGNELLAIDLPQDRDRRLIALKLRCPSTAAVYILRVPPDQTTVQGALAWSFALDRPEQYVLQQES